MHTIGLYIHIPFCDGKCHYCSFFSRRADDAAQDEYVLNLNRILADRGGRLDRGIATVYFGGGTPSLLGHDRLIGILDTVKEHFSVADDAEITVEVNPSSTGSLDFSAMRKAGFNRLSIGLQSANDDELRILGRRHSVDDVRKTVSAARRGGFDNISLDVMLAVPGQTGESLDDTLDFCAQMDARHVSAYILKVEEGTRFWRDKDKLELFTDDEQAAFYEQTVSRLKDLGYEQYEVSNFARDGRVSRHNMIYWHDEQYLGVGPSAHSFLNGERFYYPESFEDFYNGRTEYESGGGGKEEYIMLALRLSEGLIFERYKARYNEDLSVSFMKAAERLSGEGYVKLTSSSLSLTVKGFLMSNQVIGYLLSAI